MLVSYSHNNSICPRILTQFYFIRCWEARITWCSRFFGRSFCRLLSASRTVDETWRWDQTGRNFWWSEGCSIPRNLAYCYHTFSDDPPVKITTNKLHIFLFQGRSQEKIYHVHSFATAAGHFSNFYKGCWIGDSSFWRMIKMWYEPSCSLMFDATQLLLTYFCSNFC